MTRRLTLDEVAAIIEKQELTAGQADHLVRLGYGVNYATGWDAAVTEIADVIRSLGEVPDAE